MLTITLDKKSADLLGKANSDIVIDASGEKPFMVLPDAQWQKLWPDLAEQYDMGQTVYDQTRLNLVLRERA